MPGPQSISVTSAAVQTPATYETGDIGSSSITTFTRKQSPSGNELDAMAKGFSRMGSELLRLCRASDEARKNFIDEPESNSLLKVLARHLRFREAMKDVGTLDPVGFVIMSELCHELSRTCAFTPELMSTGLASDTYPIYPNQDDSPLLMPSPMIQGLDRPVDAGFNLLPTPGAENQQPVHPQLRIQPPPSWRQRNPDTSMAGRTREFILGGEVRRSRVIQFIHGNWPTSAAKPADVLSDAIKPLVFGAGPLQRKNLLDFMRRFDDDLSLRDFKLEFKGFANGNLFSPATSRAIGGARREYIANGGKIADLTYESLQEHILEEDLSGFLAFVKEGPEYVRYRVTAADIKNGYVQQSGAGAAPRAETHALPHMPLATERPDDDPRSVKRFKPTDDDEQPPGWPPVLLPPDHESSFPGATTAPIDSLQPAQPQHPGTEGFSGSFVLAGQAGHSSPISSPLLIVPDDSMSETSSQDNSQAPASRENATLDSTPAEFFDAMRKYGIARQVQSAPFPQVDMPAMQVPDLPPSDMPVTTIENANLALRSLQVPSNVMSGEINPLLQEAQPRT